MVQSLSLRDLPLPVKVVVSVFLMAVGVGYTSAIVQLHIQDSKSGKPMPTVEDVIRKYTGKKKPDPSDAGKAPISRLEALVTHPTVAIAGNTMAGAFTTDDRASGALKFNNQLKGKTQEQVAEIKAQRAGEQTAFALWINAPEDQRKVAYASDKFVPPAGKMPKAFTAAFLDGEAIKIKSLITNRCVTCHSKGGEKDDVPLDTYDGLVKFMTVEAAAPTSGEWVKVEEPISITKLTQSTHAHLLSFAVLFSLTGLVFAFSSYPTWIRCILGPWVVIAVFADVSLWWLARLCNEWGPYFAMGIIGTGALAGLGLAAQITLSLFNMYGRKGKAVIALLMIAGALVAALVVVNKIAPELDLKQNSVQKPEDKPAETNGNGNGGHTGAVVTGNGGNIGQLDVTAVRGRVDLLLRLAGVYRNGNGGNTGQLDVAVMRGRLDLLLRLAGIYRADQTVAKLDPSLLEKLLEFPVKGPDGQVLPMDQIPFVGGDDGNMARAFFDKEIAYRNTINNPMIPQVQKDRLHALRDGERRALVAWAASADPARKAAYEADQFVLPKDLAGQPISPEYAKGDKGDKVLVKTIIADRCLRCHGNGGKQADEFPLETYDQIRKYLNPPLPPAKDK
jgi:hypothetical protein